MNIELAIKSGANLYFPAVCNAIEYETERKGTPGKLTFDVVFDDAVKSIEEGNPVSLKADGTEVFYGFIFSMKRSKNSVLSVTAYDQLRYLKNKDTYVYTNKTAAEVIKMIASDFRLNLGEIEDTGLKIEARSEDNQTLFDIIQNALDATLMARVALYTLYDDFGKLTLKNASKMKCGLLIEESTAQDFDYETSIDGETYNKIKLIYENKDEGKRDVYIAQDGEAINKWGVLQYFGDVKDQNGGPEKASALLKFYDRKSKKLQISGAFSDLKIRSGSVLPVKISGVTDSFLMADRVKHTFENGSCTMDLTLIGGDFIA